MGVATTKSWPAWATGSASVFMTIVHHQVTRILCSQALCCDSMLRLRYPSSRRSATLTPFKFSVCCLAAAALLLAGCQPKKPPVSGEKPAAQGLQRLAAPPQSAAQIQALMLRARTEGDVDAVLAELDRLAAEAPAPINEEAVFRKAQLMLEMQVPGGFEAAQAAVTAMPMHALAPYAMFWQAKWLLDQQQYAQTLEMLGKVLHHPRLTRELADEVLSLGPSVALQVPEEDAVRWLLAAAEIDTGGRDGWIRAAARRASIDTLARLNADTSLSPDLLTGLDRNAARIRLMTGNTDEVQQIFVLMRTFLPNSPDLSQLQAWASGELQETTIGVMLPLSGNFARYGERALRGIRLALSSLQAGGRITLRIEDTAGQPDRAVQAYKTLLDAHAAIVIGPLLGNTTEALVPYLKPDVPVISMTSQVNLAESSPALFVHTLSPLAQVRFVANYARQQGAARMVVISDSQPDAKLEGDLFAAGFERLGGEIAYRLQLPPDTIDDRPLLRQMRAETDDEELLAELDEDLALFSPDPDMEIRMPTNFDAIYLAMSGKDVALLAGQLVYADITGVPIYGSSRWSDGHLLDDRGRYLSTARFVSVDEAGADSSRMNRLRLMYREAWGDDEPSELTLLARDTMLIATMVTSRLGMRGREIARGLEDPNGFPSLTGQVSFDASGIGQKKLDIFMLRRGRQVPAG